MTHFLLFFNLFSTIIFAIKATKLCQYVLSFSICNKTYQFTNTKWNELYRQICNKTWIVYGQKISYNQSTKFYSYYQTDVSKTVSMYGPLKALIQQQLLCTMIMNCEQVRIWKEMCCIWRYLLQYSLDKSEKTMKNLWEQMTTQLISELVPHEYKFRAFSLHQPAWSDHEWWYVRKQWWPILRYCLNMHLHRFRETIKIPLSRYPVMW
jgi:hypothetical protein